MSDRSHVVPYVSARGHITPTCTAAVRLLFKIVIAHNILLPVSGSS